MNHNIVRRVMIGIGVILLLALLLFLAWFYSEGEAKAFARCERELEVLYRWEYLTTGKKRPEIDLTREPMERLDQIAWSNRVSESQLCRSVLAAVKTTQPIPADIRKAYLQESEESEALPIVGVLYSMKGDDAPGLGETDAFRETILLRRMEAKLGRKGTAEWMRKRQEAWFKKTGIDKLIAPKN